MTKCFNLVDSGGDRQVPKNGFVIDVFDKKIQIRTNAPAAFGLRPWIDWASRGSFAVLASELNCEGNQASRLALLRCARFRA